MLFPNVFDFLVREHADHQSRRALTLYQIDMLRVLALVFPDFERCFVRFVRLFTVRLGYFDVVKVDVQATAVETFACVALDRL